MRRKLMFLTISSLLVVASLVAVVFAWFNLSNKTPPIIIILGRIEVEPHLYEVNDGVDTEITESIVINMVVPGDTFDYKLTIKNTGTLVGDLNIKIEFTSNNINLMEYLIFEEVGGASITFNQGPYTYNGVLIPSRENEDNTLTLLFRVTVSPTLERDVLIGADYIEISSIIIELSQQPIF